MLRIVETILFRRSNGYGHREKLHDAAAMCSDELASG
jgi:hypothetical protein